MKLNYKTYGQGPALIILHGLFGSLDNWVSHARALSELFSVYVLDQRNHGKSPHSSEWNYELMALDLLEFMDDQGIFRAHLLGHSMGGKTAMQFAGMEPDRIDKLIVADMAPKAYPPHHREILETLIQLDVSKLSSRQQADQLMQQGIAEASVRQFLLKSLLRQPGDGFRWKYNLPVIYAKYEEVLKAIELPFPFEGPSLFLYGTRSNYILPEDHELIRKQFPRARFQAIKGAGHWLHADAPEAFLQAVKEFLAT
ncbi:MAG: alpha/beta fold hydrolase [Bacteroidetes bacterium]|nr:MAG: alpha/beta fold hydrolase [Bacteroidota bacterium]